MSRVPLASADYIRERQHVLLLKDHVIAWLQLCDACTTTQGSCPLSNKYIFNNNKFGSHIELSRLLTFNTNSYRFLPPILQIWGLGFLFLSSFVRYDDVSLDNRSGI